MFTFPIQPDENFNGSRNKIYFLEKFHKRYANPSGFNIVKLLTFRDVITNINTFLFQRNYKPLSINDRNELYE